jgi:hypothetical protein
MSIICNLLTLNNAQIQELHQYPETIHALTRSQLHTEPNDTFLQLDKAWHGIHFALTGMGGEAAFPRGFIMSSGKEIGEENLGYGPARAFEADEVQEIADSILRIDKARFTVGLKDVWTNNVALYGIQEDPSEASNEIEYCYDYFQFLQTFLKAALEQGLGMVVYMN